MPPPSSKTEIKFASYYQYSPRGESTTSKGTKNVVLALKKDGFIRNRQGGFDRVTEKMAEMVATAPDRHSFLIPYFTKKTLLIPIPGSSPRKDLSSVWPSLSFCERLHRAGIGAGVVTALERINPVKKSATAAPGERPTPIDHYNSVKINSSFPLIRFDTITLVDDVITRGSTFLGMYRKMTEAFPRIEIHCFALVRTISSGEIDTFTNPLEGEIIFDGQHLTRRP